MCVVIYSSFSTVWPNLCPFFLCVRRSPTMSNIVFTQVLTNVTFFALFCFVAQANFKSVDFTRQVTEKQKHTKSQLTRICEGKTEVRRKCDTLTQKWTPLWRRGSAPPSGASWPPGRCSGRCYSKGWWNTSPAAYGPPPRSAPGCSPGRRDGSTGRLKDTCFYRPILVLVFDHNGVKDMAEHDAVWHLEVHAFHRAKSSYSSPFFYINLVLIWHFMLPVLYLSKPFVGGGLSGFP